MRRGFEFENQIKKVCGYINKSGGFAHKFCPERTADGTYVRGEPFDYMVITNSYKAVFDAKECSGNKWSMRKKDIKQCNELKKCKNAGFSAYFLILADKSRVITADVDEVIGELKKGCKTIHLDSLPEWDLLEKIRTGQV